MNLFDPAYFETLLKTKALGRELHYFDSIDSSNNRLKELAEQGAPEGALVLAERQSAGRGRWGRSWESPPGKNLLFSFLLRPKAGNLSQLTSIVGLACLQAMKTGKLKWPNDIWIADKKAAGILIEGSPEALVVGIGINVNEAPEEFPAELRSSATSLSIESGAELEREALLAETLLACEASYDRWQHDGFEAFRLEWNKKALFIGEKVRAGRLEGRALGMDGDGALLIETAQGVEKLVSGEVFGMRPVLD